MQHVVFTGGGTAGHVIPALPLIDALLERGVTVTFIGSTSGLEQQLLGDRALTYQGIATGKLRRYFSWQNLVDVGRVARGIWQAWRFLGAKTRGSAAATSAIDVVFSKGGYVSLPVVIAAWLRRIPVVAHESDQSPGLANRLSLRFLHSLCTNFDLPRVPGLKGQQVHTGTPVRQSLLDGDAARGRAFLGLRNEHSADGQRPVLLVTGGSLGAERVNDVVREALPELAAHFSVIHLCGPGKLEPGCQHPHYQQFEFLSDEWGDVLAAADLVVSRAGANTLCELLMLRKPHLLIPLPAVASRGDQLENARYSQTQGYSRVLDETQLTPQTLVAAVQAALQDRDLLQENMQKFQVTDPVATILRVLDDARRNA